MNRRNKVILTVGLIAILFMLGGSIFGQQLGSKSDEKLGVGYFAGGIGWMLETGDDSILYSAGGGGHTITNRWIVGGEGHSSFGQENAGGYGFINFGYLLVNTDFILVYSLLGLGGGAMTSEAESTVSQCALLNPALGMDFLLPLKKKSGILVGLRAGYAFTIHHNNTFNWSMPHVRLIAGGYGYGD